MQKKPKYTPDKEALEEFYYPGTDELYEMRKWILEYSLPKASARLQKETLFKSTCKPMEVKKEREAKNEHFKVPLSI